MARKYRGKLFRHMKTAIILSRLFLYVTITAFEINNKKGWRI